MLDQEEKRLHEIFNSNTDDLVGKLCTLVDASIANEHQAKAFKDVLKSIVRRGMTNCRDWVMGYADGENLVK